VEFVVGTCDRYVKNISEQLSQQFSAKSKEEQERQAILQSYSQISERIRVLEQKAYSYKQN
jgi:cell shape-determining protein MreC